MAAPTIPESINFPFYWDLRAAILLLARENIQARTSYLANGLVYLEPATSHLLRYGCWCPDPSRPRRHIFSDECPNTRDPPPPVVSARAVVERCWHVDECEQRRSRSHVFCFSPDATVEGFMNWFMRPRNVLRGHLALTPEQQDAVQAALCAYDQLCPAQGPSGPDAERFDALCRLLADMRRRDITREMAMAGSWHAERVHNLLEWRTKTFAACINALARAIRMVAEQRLEAEVRARRQRPHRV